ncbi:hypothetical protein [Fusobacterium sp. SYSU M8A802]
MDFLLEFYVATSWNSIIQQTPMMYLVAVIAGSVVTALLLGMLKKPITE